jgi:hypothetical protein
MQMCGLLRLPLSLYSVSTTQITYGWCWRCQKNNYEKLVRGSQLSARGTTDHRMLLHIRATLMWWTHVPATAAPPWRSLVNSSFPRKPELVPKHIILCIGPILLLNRVRPGFEPRTEYSEGLAPVPDWLTLAYLFRTICFRFRFVLTFPRFGVLTAFRDVTRCSLADRNGRFGGSLMHLQTILLWRCRYYSSETTVPTYQTTRRKIHENHNISVYIQIYSYAETSPSVKARLKQYSKKLHGLQESRSARNSQSKRRRRWKWTVSSSFSAELKFSVQLNVNVLNKETINVYILYVSLSVQWFISYVHYRRNSKSRRSA